MPGDTRKKRTPLQLKQDRVRIAEMYIQGYYQSQIGEELGLTQQQISYDLKVIQRQWLKQTTMALDEYKARELAKIDYLEQTYWKSWRRSLEDTKADTLKARVGQGQSGGQAQPIERTVKTENNCGDPRFLQGVERCIEQRRKMLGLDAEQTIKLTGDRNRPVVLNLAGLTDEELALAEKLGVNAGNDGSNGDTRKTGN